MALISVLGGACQHAAAQDVGTDIGPVDLDPVGETILEGEEDLGPIGASLGVNLSRPLDWNSPARVFRTETGFERRFGAIRAGYEFGRYRLTEDALIPLVPPGTVFRIWTPGAEMEQQLSELGSASYAGAVEADLSAGEPTGVGPIGGPGSTEDGVTTEPEARSMPWRSEQSRAERIARLLTLASEA